jgi:hypothetical protein
LEDFSRCLGRRVGYCALAILYKGLDGEKAVTLPHVILDDPFTVQGAFNHAHERGKLGQLLIPDLIHLRADEAVSYAEPEESRHSPDGWFPGNSVR